MTDQQSTDWNVAMNAHEDENDSMRADRQTDQQSVEVERGRHYVESGIGGGPEVRAYVEFLAQQIETLRDEKKDLMDAGRKVQVRVERAEAQRDRAVEALREIAELPLDPTLTAYQQLEIARSLARRVVSELEQSADD